MDCARLGCQVTSPCVINQQAHVQVCLCEEPCSTLRPSECEPNLQPSKAQPFSLRHALQQASILGHAQQAGLLQVGSAVQSLQSRVPACILYAFSLQLRSEHMCNQVVFAAGSGQHSVP